MDKATFTSDVLSQSKNNPNTLDAYKITIKVAELLRYYKHRDLIKEPDSKAKWVLSQIELLESIIQAFVSMLNYIFCLESELQKKEDCISQLFYENEKLRMDNYLLKEHLKQTIDGYLLLSKNCNQSGKSVQLFNSINDNAA